MEKDFVIEYEQIETPNVGERIIVVLEMLIKEEDLY